MLGFGFALVFAAVALAVGVIIGFRFGQRGSIVAGVNSAEAKATETLAAAKTAASTVEQAGKTLADVVNIKK